MTKKKNIYCITKTTNLRRLPRIFDQIVRNAGLRFTFNLPQTPVENDAFLNRRLQLFKSDTVLRV